ncbi:hypothetical protein RvY_12515 [Ramazzottius varieornatus]|uniref:Uncharacterized protein n=1 Tax=Ramazzottius varieornatus TaxID=947166 RepID=A0A1D1VM24_RAMVA|nr:hypothetical protein RvY_12515 [Ramazzottius varieornatus]
MIEKFEKTGSAEVKRRSGPIRKTTAIIDRTIVHKAQKFLQVRFKQRSRPIIPSTFQRRQKGAGFMNEVCLEE